MFDKIQEQNVKFTGKEYLTYLKYKDSRPKFSLSDWFKEDNNKFIFTISIILLVCLISFVTLYNMYTYQPPTPFNFTWEGIGMFVAICIGIGWVIHGVGFQLVRVR